jgi:hypothetical protein
LVTSLSKQDAGKMYFRASEESVVAKAMADKQSPVPLVGDGQISPNGLIVTRFLEFLAGVLSKGVWWMP